MVAHNFFELLVGIKALPVGAKVRSIFLFTYIKMQHLKKNVYEISIAKTVRSEILTISKEN